MRHLDYWAGIPLCFLLSGLNHILKIVKTKNGPVKKILIIKLSELGAIILSYPLLKCIRKKYPSADIFFMTFSKNRDVFKLLGGAIAEKNVLTIREDSMFAMTIDLLKALLRLRKEKIDVAFDLEFFSRFTAIFSCLAGADKRAGFYKYTFEGSYRGSLLTHRIQYNPLSHIAKNYLSMSQDIEQNIKYTPQLEKAIDDKELVFPVYVSNEAAGKSIARKLKIMNSDTESRLFLINPGEGILPLREWPIECFIELIRRILKDKNSRIAIIGAEGAADKAIRILKEIDNSRCISLVNQTALDELLELFNIAEALISNDCGLAHLGMLTSVRKFIIFGPESPQVFGPLGDNIRLFYSHWPCSPCLSVLNNRASACDDNKCLKAIKPDDIYAEIK